MKASLLSLAAVLGLASTVLAQDPPFEPGFPIPRRALAGMPRDVANRLRFDIERVNDDFRRMSVRGPIVDGPRIVEFVPGPAEFRHREQTSYSCVNGVFALRHCLNGVHFRVN